jgi:protein-S-isoprenylcysteine O-methyltransferase Ste14
VLIRWPHGNRIKTLAINENRQGRAETVLLIGAALGTTLIPLAWATTGFPSFADYPLHPLAFASGLFAMVIGNWLFYRSHADLGIYWSPTLQMREDHQLMTSGVYSRIRHPMYTAMIVQGVGQVLFLPNWIAGPAWLLTFGILYVFRVGYEERMMKS